MGESFALPNRNVENNVLAQPSLPTVATEDDEEPPSSGRRLSRSTEVTTPERLPPFFIPNIPTKPFDVAYTLKNSTTASDRDHQKEEHFSHPSRLADVERQLHVPAWRPELSRTARMRALFTPTHQLGPPPTFLASLKAIITYSPLNLCLVFIPLSWALHFTHQSPTLVFVFSALGIIPLAALLGLGTEQIALRTSQSVGGLLNATLGNIIEMIISGIALQRCELELIQSSLLGGLLSNLLLVLGMAFIVGGFRFHQQEFHPMVAQLNSSLMIVAVLSLTVPAAFHQYLEHRLPEGKEVGILLQLSRGSALILISIYVAYLFFQFYSHNHLFLDTIQTPTSSHSSCSTHSSSRASTDTLPPPGGSSLRPASPASSRTSVSSTDSIVYLKLNTPSALVLLALCTAFAYVTADHLVASLEGLIAAHPRISKEWITLIVIPIIGNAAEHTTAVLVASKGKFDLAMSVAVGSCIQIALFVIPLLVLIAWGLGKPLTLLFDPMETIVLFFSVLLVKFSVEDGKSHWMSGLVLMAAYILIALSFWNFPDHVRLFQGEPLLCIRG